MGYYFCVKAHRIELEGSVSFLNLLVHYSYMKKITIFILGIALIGFFTYSILEYKKTGVSERGLITCAEGQCYWTAHIHTWVRINVCGKEISLSKLVGPLSGIHTHTEENILHWHDRLTVDPETRELLPTDILRIGFGLQSLSIPFTTDGILEEKNGDLCPDGKEGTLKFFVNGKPFPPDPSFVWSDHDIIDIIFDGKSGEEAFEYVQTLPKQFPILSNG